MWCLPLNQTYEVGGDLIFSNTFKTLGAQITCNRSCHVNSCGNLVLYQVSSNINPSNSESPVEYSLQRDDVALFNTVYQNKVSKIDENILETE